MAKHPGLFDSILKLLREHPDKGYSPADLSRTFPKVKIATLQYHLNQGREKGAFFSEKRGFYVFNPKYRTAAEIRQEVDQLPKRVVSSGREYSALEAPLQAVDTRWARLLKRHVSSIKARMNNVNKLREEGNQVFTPEDFEVIDELVNSMTADVDKLLAQTAGKTAANGTTGKGDAAALAEAAALDNPRRRQRLS